MAEYERSPEVHSVEILCGERGNLIVHLALSLRQIFSTLFLPWRTDVCQLVSARRRRDGFQ